ncbi:MAG: LUD domain-containing protein [Planctomicrobium sp.]|jgi:L-lactate dehydrogenase complex protein LldG|nr:LUD domain-containing protein [Planctomicrobium sp.]
MSSRDQILHTIRKNLPQAVPLPDHSGNWIQYDDPVAQFTEVLNGVGGDVHIISSVSEIPAHFEEFVNNDQFIVSCVDGVFDGRFDLSTVTDPHDLQGVDLAILPGELGVAENGAIWVTDEHVPIRVLYFLTQHLSLVLPKSMVLNNMHEAYEQIDPALRAFGTFISGPSKTADIEQSLVKGAHGARTMKVFLIEDSNG